jgi:hypothetical protein
MRVLVIQATVAALLNVTAIAAVAIAADAVVIPAVILRHTSLPARIWGSIIPVVLTHLFAAAEIYSQASQAGVQAEGISQAATATVPARTIILIAMGIQNTFRASWHGIILMKPLRLTRTTASIAPLK